MATYRNNARLVEIDRPHFLSIGRICFDVQGEGRILGGSAAYSAILARNLGYRSAIVTSAGQDFPQDTFPYDILLKIQVGEVTTTFINHPTQHGRDQFVGSIASPIEPVSIPESWLESDIVYLCPILNDFDPDIINCLRPALVGVAPQGWMRTVGNRGRVYKRRFEELEMVVPQADVVIVSEEDPCLEDLQKLTQHSHILVVTRGRNGADLFWQWGRYHKHIPAFGREEIDETGAGDVFGAAFLLRYEETKDAVESALFASWMASFVVQGRGTKAIPGKAEMLMASEAAPEHVGIYNLQFRGHEKQHIETPRRLDHAPCE